ncbi:MAG: biotin--[acetyl-CoA-carboxylase] ligase [Pseudomonadota bacterium]|nr:biotin--[acetyl-CoA-carboxylase] ligase [Pseudomonadota bacterium]
MEHTPTQVVGTRLFNHDTLDSTNNEAIRLIEEGKGEGAVVVANCQTAGRGRRGKIWKSPPGNLYLSIIFPAIGIKDGGQVAYFSAVSVGDAITSFLSKTVRIRFKWPNDLLIEQKKIGGILIEKKDDFYVIGVGLNIIKAPTLDEGKSISLQMVGVSTNCSSLIQEIIKKFRVWNRVWRKKGFTKIRDAWVENATGIGSRIVIKAGNGIEERGIFMGVDKTGALHFKKDNGEKKKIFAGEIFCLENT